MNSKCSLPILLVSACDRVTAEQFMSELIDNEITDTENGVVGDPEESDGRVWRLVNKYYRADVLVRPYGDSDPPPDHTTRIEAHVAYFTPEECKAAAAVQCAERRAWMRAGVRVAALQAACEGALGAWAARALYEPVPLQDEAMGIARVRDALHAHPWPGLRRLDRAAPTLPYRESDDSSSGGEEQEKDEEGEEADVERAEQFALALSALGDAGVHDARAEAIGDSERRERAEQLLAAFCRALGHRLDC